MQQVADAAGVSRMTVSRSLRNDPSIPPHTRLRVQSVAKQLGYQPDARVSELMTHLRQRHGPRRRETIAYIHFRPSNELDMTVSDRRFLAGAQARATETGYRIEQFTAEASTLSITRLHSILWARGIRGAVLELFRHLPDNIEVVYRSLACAVIGRTVDGLPLHSAVSHQYVAMLRAVETLWARGYRRIGYYGHVITDLNQRHIWAATLLQQQDLRKVPLEPRLIRIVSFWDEVDFCRWLHETKPDVVVTNHRSALVWIRSCGLRVPEDIGFVDIDWSQSSGDCAGIDQHLEHIGAATVDLVARQLVYNELGPPAFRKTVMIEPAWVDGDTVQPARERALQ